MSPKSAAGTYAGVASEPVIQHLLDLGVTAVELLPVHFHLNDRHLVERGLTNYWGYNTLGFFAPHLDYASKHSPRKSVQEFKMMVRALHAAGIEVILDVVYNHTVRRQSALGRRSPCAAWTTLPITGLCRTTSATTWISRAAATH